MGFLNLLSALASFFSSVSSSLSEESESEESELPESESLPEEDEEEEESSSSSSSLSTLFSPSEARLSRVTPAVGGPESRGFNELRCHVKDKMHNMSKCSSNTGHKRDKDFVV